MNALRSAGPKWLAFFALQSIFGKFFIEGARSRFLDADIRNAYIRNTYIRNAYILDVDIWNEYFLDAYILDEYV